jgi:hypothetical protein
MTCHGLNSEWQIPERRDTHTHPNIPPSTENSQYFSKISRGKQISFLLKPISKGSHSLEEHPRLTPWGVWWWWFQPCDCISFSFYFFLSFFYFFSSHVFPLFIFPFFLSFFFFFSHKFTSHELVGQRKQSSSTLLILSRMSPKGKDCRDPVRVATVVIVLAKVVSLRKIFVVLLFSKNRNAQLSPALRIRSVT